MLKITNTIANKKVLSANQLQQGKIYKYQNAEVYFVCNLYNEIIAFSLCGDYVVSQGSGGKFVEVEAELTISEEISE